MNHTIVQVLIPESSVEGDRRIERDEKGLDCATVAQPAPEGIELLGVTPDGDPCYLILWGDDRS